MIRGALGIYFYFRNFCFCTGFFLDICNSNLYKYSVKDIPIIEHKKRVFYRASSYTLKLWICYVFIFIFSLTLVCFNCTYYILSMLKLLALQQNLLWLIYIYIKIATFITDFHFPIHYVRYPLNIRLSTLNRPVLIFLPIS